MPRSKLFRWWLAKPLRAKGLVVVAIPLATLIVVATLGLVLQVHERNQRAVALATSNIDASAQQIVTDALNAETGVRGFVATRQEVFLQPYSQALEQLPRSLRALSVAAGPSGDVSQVRTIEVSAKAEFALLSDLRRTALSTPPSDLIGQLETQKKRMDQLRAQVASITNAGSILVAHQRTQISNFETAIEVVDILGLVLAILAGLAGIALFATGISRRLKATVANADRLGRGEALEASAQSPDELGQLDVALSRAEKLLTQRAVELVAARDEAVEATRAKNGFLSRTSHELRTPLNAILGFAQLLEMSPLEEVDRDSNNHILKAGRHLLSLINELLDLSRIESGELSLSLEPVPLSPLVTEVVNLMAPLAAARSLTIEQHCTSLELAALADRQRFNQILLNLVSNAVKYNREGGTIEITCGARDDFVDVRVIDTGPGLTNDDIEKIFLPFERLHAQGSGIEGSGIGLTLSGALAHAMGGEISVTSEIGRGSTFFLRLPRATNIATVLTDEGSETRPKQSAVRTEDGFAHTLRVLYIEDNLANVQIIERFLGARYATTLYTAMSGQLGIDLARQHHPDIILLDLHLPDVTGDDVFERLRADPDTATIPVVMLSADATAGAVRRLLERGAKAYLTKPLDFSELGAILDDLQSEWESA